MASPTIDQIMMALPRLSPEERGRIKTAVSSGLLDSTKARPPREEDEDEHFLIFYSILRGALREAVGGRVPERVGVLPPKVQRTAREGWQSVETLLEQVAPKAGQRTRLRFYQMVVDATIDYVDNLEHVPVALRTVSEQLNNCGAIMNQNFPGYVRAGVMRLLLEWGRPGTPVDGEDL